MAKEHTLTNRKKPFFLLFIFNTNQFTFDHFIQIMLISTIELDTILNDPNVIITDTRSFKEYSEGHIPGAVHLDLFAFHWIDTTEKGIENFNNQTQNLLSFLGVTPEKKVIFYDSVSGMLAARGVWMLMYFSHENVSMLDGGITKWKKEHLSLETKLNGFKPSNFSGKVNQNIISGFEYIRDNLDNLKILDVRSSGEYDGSTIRAAQSGHIPNSINIDWNQNITKDGTFKNNDELSQMYDISKNTEIVTYCQGAYRAANTFLVLKKLGFQNVRVYLGSWGEWGNKLELPVEK
jgi:thiosulfate/3-mercaptopyruvate sulfurtransferase